MIDSLQWALQILHTLWLPDLEPALVPVTDTLTSADKLQYTDSNINEEVVKSKLLGLGRYQEIEDGMKTKQQSLCTFLCQCVYARSCLFLVKFLKNSSVVIPNTCNLSPPWLLTRGGLVKGHSLINRIYSIFQRRMPILTLLQISLSFVGCFGTFWYWHITLTSRTLLDAI